MMRSAAAKYASDGVITAEYTYQSVIVERSGDGETVAKPITKRFEFITTPPQKVGLMLVGLGGNNGTTVVGGIIANREKIEWRTKEGIQKADWIGSVLLSSTAKIGIDKKSGDFVSAPLSCFVPLIKPETLEVSGWDISNMSLGDAMRRAAVFDIALQDQLYEKMNSMKPLKGCYIPDFIAANQEERADNVIKGNRKQCLTQIRKDIQDFKNSKQLDKVIVLWTGTTERFCEETKGIHDTADNLLAAIDKDHSEISASTIYGAAAVLEGCTYINGSPQNTNVPGLIELAKRNNAFVAGDDFKSGQTKFKSVLTDFLISSGLKVTSIVSYNHLGNNDGYNLSSYKQFRSKEISKSNVVDDMVRENSVLYKSGECPDHCVVIKYVPAVGDSKRAMDEYASQIFMGGKSTIAIHNVCEDSLLAAPIIIDLVLLADLCSRVRIRDLETGREEPMHTVLSLLSFLCKAPLVPNGTPVVNAFNAQRMAIVNFLRACIGLPADNSLCLEHRLLR